MSLTAGSLSLVSVTAISDSLLSTAASAGTTPYAYQWYRSLSSGFVPASSNAVSGATSLTLAETGLTPRTIYYYKQVVIDSAATPATVTTSQLAVTTLAAPVNLSISNVINVSVATPQTGLGEYNTANLALFTRESYASTFGTLGYKIYLSPTEVATDFGTGSNTFAMANGVFSQQPNILNNNGYLVIIPFLSNAQTAVQLVSFHGTPASGTFELTYNGNSTTALASNVNAAAVQAALRLLAGLSTVVVTGSIAAGFTITEDGVSGVGYPFTISANSLLDSNSVAVVPVVSVVVPGSSAETIDQAIIRTQDLIQYFGIMSAEVPSQLVMLAAAAVIQPLNKIGFFVSFTAADISPGGMLDLLTTGGFTQSRGLFYNDTLATSLVLMASYAGLGLSTNFNGSNTTQTMHLKTLIGVQPDPGLPQTYLNEAIAAGADTYPSIQGVAKVFCSGENDFYDNQFNLQWLVGALQVAGFNALAQTNTKIPQTENGMNILKGAYRTVCEQGVTNQFIAPGVWTSSTTFGNQADLLLNVAQRGYYIFSAPVSQQLPSVRALRQAPLVQIAIKYAGAIQSSDVIVYVNP